MEGYLKDKIGKTLFHGTLKNRADSIIEKGIDFTKLNDVADFGKGFYLTDSYALAKDTAITRYNQEVQSIGKENANLPVIMRVKFKNNHIIRLNYSIKEFYGETIEWKEVLTKNTNLDHNLDLKYDIVIGLTADGKMSYLKKSLKQNNFVISEHFLNKLTPYITRYAKIIGTKLKTFSTKAYQISIHNMELINTCVVYRDYDIIRLEKEDGSYE